MLDMSQDHFNQFSEMQDLPVDDSDDDTAMPINNQDDLHNAQAFLDGSTRIDLSHKGGEFTQSLEEDIEEEMAPKSKYNLFLKFEFISSFGRKAPVPDYRACSDRTNRLVDAWEGQMEGMVESYMVWSAEIDFRPQRREGPPPAVPEIYDVLVVDLYSV
jgi:hypothetical protein